MKILIIEDNQFKADNLINHIRDFYKWEDYTLRKSYNSALIEILSGTIYDLIILDISIPNFDVSAKDNSGDFMPLGGKHLLSQIYFNEINAKVLVLTMFENFDDGSEIKSLDKLFKEHYSELYLGYVLYNILDNKWKLDMTELLTINSLC